MFDTHVHIPTYTVDPVQFARTFTDTGITDIVIIADIGDNPGFKNTRDVITFCEKNAEYFKSINLKTYPVAGVDFEDINCSELVELLETRKIYGFKLYPGYQYFYPYDKKLDELYKTAAKYKIPVIIHSGDCHQEGGKPLLKYSHPLHIDEAAVLYPDVTFIMAHCGNPWFTDAKAVVYKNKNVYADFSGLYITPDDVYQRRLYDKIVDMIVYTDKPRRFLFGSDYPIVKNYAEYKKFIHSCMPSGKRDRMFSLNAQGVFHGR